jgi:predicted dehydrogenase
MDDIRIGVIGAWGRGNLASRAHRPGEGSRIVAGADPHEAQLERFANKYGRDNVNCYRDYRALLEQDDIDAVFVTSPDYCHEEQAMAALDAGKHVYLEKPMAITIEGCDRILQMAYDRKVKLYLGHNMRHMNFTQKMKELIDFGAIGEPKAGWCRHFVAYGGDAYFKDWHAERSKSTGLLLQKGAHDIDILHWLCGGYSQRVTAFGNLSVYNQIEDRHAPEERGDARFRVENWPPLKQTGMNPTIDVEDLSMMLMTLDNGVLCSYQQCHYSPDAWRNYTIIGTEGRVENSGEFSGVVNLYNTRSDQPRKEADASFQMERGEGGHGGGDGGIVDEFVRYIREGGTIKTSPIAARNSVAAGCMATESLRDNGVPRDVPPVDPEIREYFDKDVE